MAIATIELEFNAGADINDAFTEAIRIAKLLNCNVTFDFNGVMCLAHPEGIADEGIAMYHRYVKNDSTYKVAVT